MLTVIVVVAALSYFGWAMRRAARRTAVGRCGRCGDPLAEGASHHGQSIVCGRCTATAARNHRAAFWFLVALAPLMVFAIGMGLLSDISAGFGVGWEYLPAFFFAVAIPLGLAFALRRAMTSKQL